METSLFEARSREFVWPTRNLFSLGNLAVGVSQFPPSSEKGKIKKLFFFPQLWKIFLVHKRVLAEKVTFPF